MPDAYEIAEGRYLNETSNVSAANGLSITVGPVPANKVWTIRVARCNCDVAETQVYWFAILTRASVNYPITVPQSVTITPAAQRYYPALTEGMEIKLFPGDHLVAHRAAATAGSVISINVCYYETDLPLYVYDEPQIVKRQKRGVSQLKSVVGGGISGPRGEGGAEGGGGEGGGGRGLPI